MSWDAAQRDALSAFGYRLYRRVGEAGADAGAPPDDPLSRALLRAAGRSLDDPEAARLCREWPAVAQLRDAAAKRALWPRLRALRSRAP
ncbi:hypothetical protein [Luteimonas abyssi]|uniref:hypothetical protein n=1 Tax=Luteimonas abyssi TaxID=1247514 RepID=UPI000A4106DF|nr:hypothetical protein [Luteimonas abyssi]